MEWLKRSDSWSRNPEWKFGEERQFPVSRELSEMVPFQKVGILQELGEKGYSNEAFGLKKFEEELGVLRGRDRKPGF